MAVIPFKIRADGYTFDEPNTVDRRQTYGGPSFFRQDADSASIFVTASFFIPYYDLNAFWNWFNFTILKGSAMFQAMLIIDTGNLVSHNCYLVPDTQTLVPEGLDYVFKTKLEVLRNPLATILDTQVVTSGIRTVTVNTYYGFAVNLSSGSIVDGTSNIYAGAAFTHLYNLNNASLALLISGNLSNSGWASMKLDGYTYNRASATYAYISGTNRTSWTWTIQANHFDVEGAETVVTWE